MFEYFRNPTYQIDRLEETSLSSKIKGTLNNFAIYICIAFVLFMILSLVDLGITKYFHFSIMEQMRVNQQKIMKKHLGYSILLMLFIGPFFEEVLFRLPLRLSKVGIGVSLALITYRILVDHLFVFDFKNSNSYIKLVAAIFVFFLIMIFLPKSKLEQIKQKYFMEFFYFVAVSFALVHLSNFAPFNSNVLLFYPIFILPQLLMGLFIGYTRMKYGFVFGLALHSLINLPAVIITSLIR